MTTRIHDLERVSIRCFRGALAQFVGGVRRSRRPIILTSRGRDVAAVAPLATLELAAHAAGASPGVADVAAGLREVAVGAAALPAPKPEE